ncbi:MAG: aldo/keto reductase [Gemmatimonadetes bacterium]|nr:aldo/keto reductase [Gemmatimonadota bacterium]MXX72808.1 aldo/keto reductase [Gemmatimonadota bacterium]MYC91184.1 aldo/keto reductase [Gemmatimonadota bacterium]MYG35743.1 aldo/keto reductase [Gemmatimonadota bacterium]MYJ18956.1 aldo/keto reductase [Gemmatimonadota bacterium]
MATRGDTTRRDFLLRMAGVGAALATPRAVIGERPRQQPTLPTRTIPGTDETLPIVGFGSSKPVLEIPTEGTEPVAAVIRVLLEHGGRVVDTSPRTPEIDAEFGRVLTAPEFQGRLFVATKINTDGRIAGITQMRQNQRLVGRRTLDLLQVESMRDLDVHWPSVLRWRDSGEARYIGVTVSSNGRHDDFEAVMRSEPLDFVQINYSVMEPGAEDRLLPLAQDLGMAVLINRPFMNGSYFGRVSGRTLPDWAAEFDCATWAQFSLKYILAHPAVTCALTETTNPDHMADNIGAGFGRLPDEAMKRRMRELVRGF